MNEINEIINNKLETYPSGFGVNDVEIWLNDIPKIHSFPYLNLHLTEIT